MGNMVSYLKWRGDLSFEERKFCLADNMIFSTLAYLDFEGIVSDIPLDLSAAADTYRKTKMTSHSFSGKCEEVLYACEASRRYKDVKLLNYTEHTDEATHIQFAAVTFILPDQTRYIAYRGTDDSVNGWREDFCISYEVIPAQIEALQYLEDATETNGQYRVGGHSKGGNLALYACMNCSMEKQEQIIEIYSNDGPGLSEEHFNKEGYERIKDRLIRITPEYCVIGKLFEVDKKAWIIKSSAKEFNQHDICTWQIEGDELVLTEKYADKSCFYDQVFSTWIESADNEQRKTFTKDFFDALQADGATKMSEVSEGGVDGFGTILLSIVTSQSRTKIAIIKLLQAFMIHLKEMHLMTYLKSKKGSQSLLAILAGIIIILAPSFAIKSIATFLTLFGFLWSANKLITLAMKESIDQVRKRRKLIVYIVCMVCMIFLATHQDILQISGNILLGALFLIASFTLLKQIADARKKTKMDILKAIFAILLFFLACVALSTPDQAFEIKMVAAGSACILYGLANILKQVFTLEDASF